MCTNRSWLAVVGVLVVSVVLRAQTFEVNGSGSRPSAKSARRQHAGLPADSSMGWGSSIEVARQLRAAQDALRRGDYSAATTFAQRVVKAAPKNPDFWFLLAYSARLAGRYSISIDAYNRGLAERPSSVEGLSGLAQTYAHVGRNQEAQALLQRVLAANPHGADDLQLAGELLLNSDPQKALSYLQKAETERSRPRTELLMARAYGRLHQPDQVRRWLDRARRSAPHDPEILRSVAAYYRDNGQYDDAVRLLRSLPLKDASSLTELAYTYELAGKRNQAADLYLRAADTSPRRIDYQLGAAQALINAGRLPQAQGVLDRAQALDPEHYRLHALRGEIDETEGKYEDGIREYQTAIRNLPESTPEGVLYPISLHVDLYQLYRDNGDSASAEREAAIAREQIKPLDIEDAGRPDFLRLRAAIEMAFNNPADAERDLKEAMKLQPASTALLLNYANLLWKTDRKHEAFNLYTHVLQLEPSNPAALSSLGYLSRQLNKSDAAMKYFQKLAKLHPENPTAHLALGDLYAERRQFDEAQQDYEEAHRLAPRNALVFARGINAALGSHKLPVAKHWLDRASGIILQDPQVMREHERYLTLTGRYQESADLGRRVVEKLPNDPEAPVYLAYDLLFLHQYSQALDVVHRFQPGLPKDKDLWLITGYVDDHYHRLNQAVEDFTRALEIEPDMAMGYMNRGYVRNDLRMATSAESDFKKAIQLQPDYGEAHLGLAYSYLELRRPRPALKEAETAEKLLGESRPLHLAKAESYRQQILLAKAVPEYLAALRYEPGDVTTRLALAEAQYRLRRYEDSIASLNAALKYAPPEPALLYAQMARAYARLQRREDAAKAIEIAERTGSSDGKVLLATADTLMILGERDQAMLRYTKLLDLSDADRLAARLAVARIFSMRGKWADAREQIGIAFAEARVSNSAVISADDYLNAAGILMSINDFKPARDFIERAEAAGADPSVTAIAMANVDLAVGKSQDAQTLLASLPADSGQDDNFDYLVAMGNVCRQRQDVVHALGLFARASSLEPDNDSVRNAEFDLAGIEGRQVTENLSLQSEVSLAPIFEDENIYQMDARLRGLSAGSLLPPPRRSLETFADSRFRMHFNGFPTITGFVGERNARGTISFPNELLIQRRNTYDTIFNGAITHVFRLPGVTLSATPGLQFTIRRDTASPVQMDQNLFRQFLYVSSNPIGNWLSFSGDLIRDAGPFTEQNLHSRDFSGAIDFRVGRPWGKTALITGYRGRDELFGPAVHEFYESSTYAGLEHKFGSKITASATAEFLRSWRVEGRNFVIAQSLRPGFTFEARPSERWTLSASGFWSQGKGMHVYDDVTNSILLSYTKTLRGSLNDGTENTQVSYPLHFSIGVEQQTFYNFPGESNTSIVPVVKLTLF
jgi:tetratricopeptide (TPR) repeat protein